MGVRLWIYVMLAMRKDSSNLFELSRTRSLLLYFRRQLAAGGCLLPVSRLSRYLLEGGGHQQSANRMILGELPMKPVLRCCVLLLIAICAQAPAQDLNTALMKTTFKIYGPAAPVNGQAMNSSGTVFILGQPSKDDPHKGQNVLITAAHVLDEITGDFAFLQLHHLDAKGKYVARDFKIPLRSGGAPLYVKHADADVAAMYVALPNDEPLSLLPLSALVSDDDMEKYEIHPGDELLCLGFPLLVDVNTFPVIRSGLLASYPIVPTKNFRTFVYNFHIFEGNSGGPVYFSYSNRVYGGAIQIGQVQGLIGLVSQKQHSTLPGHENAELDMSIIVPSPLILETVKMLPENPGPVLSYPSWLQPVTPAN
jgi:hypothetical protein